MSKETALVEAFKRHPTDIARRLIEMAVYNDTKAGRRKAFDDVLDSALTDPFFDIELAQEEEEIDLSNRQESLLKRAENAAKAGEIVSAIGYLLACSDDFPATAPEDQPNIMTAPKVCNAVWGAYANTVMPLQIMNNRNTVFMINMALRMKLDVQAGDYGPGGIINMKLHPRGASLLVPSAVPAGMHVEDVCADVKAAAMRAVYAFAFSHRDRIEESEWAEQEGADATASLLVADALVSAMGTGSETFGIGQGSVDNANISMLASQIMSKVSGVAEHGDVTGMTRDQLQNIKADIDGLGKLAGAAGDLAAKYWQKNGALNGFNASEVKSAKAYVDNQVSSGHDVVAWNLVGCGQNLINGLTAFHADSVGISGQTLDGLQNAIASTLAAFGASYRAGRAGGGHTPSVLTFRLEVAKPLVEGEKPTVSIKPMIIRPSFEGASAWVRSLIAANEEAGGGDGEGDGGATNELLKQLACLGQDPNPNQADEEMSEEDKLGDMGGGKDAGEGFREVMKLLDLDPEYGGHMGQRDWIELLNRALIKAMGFERHLTWTKPNRRFAAQSDIYMPGFKRDKPGRLAICIDESGSIDEDQLKKFGEEMCRALEVVAPQGVDILHFSHTMQVESLEQGQMWEPKRWLDGGTNFQQCYDWLNEAYINGAQYDAVLFFTDLYGESGCLSKDRRPIPDVPFIWVTYATSHKTEFGAHIDIQTGEISGESLEMVD